MVERKLDNPNAKCWKETREFFARLKKFGFTPSLIIDIGAYEGVFSELASDAWPEAYVWMIEANPEQQDILNSVKTNGPTKVSIATLGRDNGKETTFFYNIPHNCVDNNGSSLYPENTPIPKETRKVVLCSFENLATEMGVAVTPRTLLKLDTQGSELDILNGFTKDQLKNVEFICTEISFVEYNLGSPDWIEVALTFERLGFRPYALGHGWYKPTDGSLFQADVLFVNTKSEILKSNFWNYDLTEKESETVKNLIPEPEPNKTFNIPAIHLDRKGTLEYIDEIDILHEIYEAKIYEPLLERVKDLKHVKFADLGCHVGHFTRHLTRELANRGATWEGVLVDANEKSLEIAKTRLSDVENIRFYHGALGKFPNETVDFRVSDYHGMDCIVSDKMDRNLKGETVVTVPGIDLYPCTGWLLKNADQLDLVKVDIEGAEFDLVSTLQSSMFFQYRVANSMFEVHRQIEDPEVLRTAMRNLGFKHKITNERDLTSMELFWKEKTNEN